MRIEELESKGDWQGLRDYAKADALYAKENPCTYSCPACIFSSREKRIFTTQLAGVYCGLGRQISKSFFL
jgi:ferredoxin-like protein FixX